MTRTASLTLATALSAAVLAACGSMPPMSTMDNKMDKMMASGFSQDSLPAAVQVPMGNKVALETVGMGQITYECRAKTGMADAFEWAFVGPEAALNNRMSQRIGRYYGPPATWEAMDGSKVTATQVAVAPAGDGNIPLQLVKANPAMGSGAMSGITYIQRVATRGGTAPALPCAASSAGQRSTVQYQADYIFWKAA